MGKTIALVTPVLDDWVSFAAVVSEIVEEFTGSGIAFQIYAVDDGSSTGFDPTEVALPAGSCVAAIEVIRLAANLGHQRAIAVGLCAVAESGAADAVLVMDSDGQDRPADIGALLAAGARHPRHIVFAGRAERSESRAFRSCYRLYRLIFRALTGQSVSFGNFCVIPMAALRRLVHMPELWNHLAACAMRSRLPYMTVPTVRGRRSSCRSKMNSAALIVHGLSAMSVYADTIFVRILLAATGVAAAACLGIVAVGFIRVATRLAIPGWATAAIGDLLIMLMQTFVIMIAASLTMLAGRSNRPVVPIVDCLAFVAQRERFGLERRKPVAAAARPAA